MALHRMVLYLLPMCTLDKLSITIDLLLFSHEHLLSLSLPLHLTSVSLTSLSFTHFSFAILVTPR
jgi:hypothetical protein